MEYNIRSGKESLSRIYGRLMWATIRRKDRLIREKAYFNLVQMYGKMVDSMWRYTGDSNEFPPKLYFKFDKNFAVAVFGWVTPEDEKRSNLWELGDKDNRKNIAKLFDLNANEEIPFHISDEIIAATAIASLLSDEEAVDEGSINQILTSYYENQEFDPIEISTVWLSRLNTTMCNIWKMAPVMKRTIEIMEGRKIDFLIAQKIAMEEVRAPELPKCLNSNNGDGRMNMSYMGSNFYTIDHYGIAICKEYPNEFLNLADYEMMRTVASTIYRDITMNSDLNDLGISGANMIFEEEPEWMNGNLFPWERVKNESEDSQGAESTKDKSVDYQEAIADYSKAIEIDPQDAKSYYNRGIVKAELEDYQGAIADYNKAIEINPNDADFYGNRGCVKIDTEDYLGAIEDFDNALEINSNDYIFYYNRSVAKIKLGDYRGAIDDLSKAMEINPNDIDSCKDRGFAKIKLKDYRGAIADFNKALELNPQDASAHYNLGNAKNGLGDYQEAIVDFTKAIEINPQDAGSYVNRGTARFRIKDYLGAILDCSQAIEINPQNSTAYLNRGIAKGSSGDHKSACIDIEKAAELGDEDAAELFMKNCS